MYSFTIWSKDVRDPVKDAIGKAGGEEASDKA